VTNAVLLLGEICLRRRLQSWRRYCWAECRWRHYYRIKRCNQTTSLRIHANDIKLFI